MKYRVMLFSTLALLIAQVAFAQNKRDTAVRNDKKALADDASWFYDDLQAGLKEAAETKRPLMIVFR